LFFNNNVDKRENQFSKKKTKTFLQTGLSKRRRGKEEEEGRKKKETPINK